MTTRPKLTLCLMDGPFEQARTVSAFRLLDLAVRRGCDVTVFAYEGAVGLTFAGQSKHANAVHGRDVEQEDHPLPREWVAALMRSARDQGSRLNWINCGLCVDERGMADAIEGCRRGAPTDLLAQALESNNTLIMGTR